jgi:hypothetical protein
VSRAFVRSVGLALGLAIAVAGCAADVEPVTFPPASFGPGPVSGAAAATVGSVTRALGARSIQVRDAAIAYRPPESPALAAAPRHVIQALMPDDPTHGYISVYEFDGPDMALAAGREMAAYVASGPGRVQFTPDTEVVLRRVGLTLVYFSWATDNSPDARAAEIAEALGTVGEGIPIGG